MATYTPEQRKVVQTILKVGRQRGASPKEIKAAIETGLVESNLRNLHGGDADSAGWRQERASLYPDPTNVQHSAARFFDEARKANQSGKYGSAGSLAAAVQRPAAQYRGRYQQRSGDAESLLSGLGGGGSRLGSRSTTTTTTTTPGVDNAQARRDLIAGYLAQGGVRNSDATATFAAAYRNAQDVPGTSSTSRVRSSSGSSSPSSRTSGAGGSEVLELIHNNGAKGYGIKNGQVVNGQQVFAGVWAGHADHVHVAAGPKTVVALGKLAQSMGLHVGENPHFGGVNPGAHVPGSYHVKGEAIDVSGDPKLMDAFARRVEQYNRSRTIPRR